MKTGTQSLHRILCIGLQSELLAYTRETFSKTQEPYLVRSVEPLRIGAPETQIESYRCIILLWERHELQNLSDAISTKTPKERSPEGILFNLEQIGGEPLLKRVLVVGAELTRDETVLIGEMGVKHVINLPQKRSKWDSEKVQLIDKAKKLILQFDSPEAREERLVAQYSAMLKAWKKISDETRMRVCEQLLKTFGDSARYAELMAQKSITEGDDATAEKWLIRALEKNPQYLKAAQQLASLYMRTRQYEKALSLLEKLNLNSPRNITHLVRKGQCFMALGEYHKAETILSRALLLDEYNNMTRENLGKVKCMLGEYELAKELLATTQNTRELAIFLNQRGVKFVEKEDYDSAIEHYKAAQYVIPGNNESPLLFLNIALAYLKYNKPNEALRYARIALIRDPQYQKALQLIQYIEKKYKHTCAL